MQARVPGTTSPVGQWQVIDSSNSKTLICSYSGGAVTQTNNADKSEITFNWIAPAQAAPGEIAI